mmetsp:Transcript_31423/g.72266  ORF Transcript_31423/g.72266 Transcript_31423/m.72266 type:complete len:213 (-) Transcript_31423:630-1268(-)
MLVIAVTIAVTTTVIAARVSRVVFALTGSRTVTLFLVIAVTLVASFLIFVTIFAISLTAFLSLLVSLFTLLVALLTLLFASVLLLLATVLAFALLTGLLFTLCLPLTEGVDLVGHNLGLLFLLLGHLLAVWFHELFQRQNLRRNLRLRAHRHGLIILGSPRFGQLGQLRNHASVLILLRLVEFLRKRGVIRRGAEDSLGLVDTAGFRRLERL